VYHLVILMSIRLQAVSIGCVLKPSELAN